MILPEIARIMIVVLVADLIATLLTITLSFTTIFDSPRSILSQIVAGRARPSGIWPSSCAWSPRVGSSGTWTSGTWTSGAGATSAGSRTPAGNGALRRSSSTALQKISRSAAWSSCACAADSASSWSGNVQEVT